MGKISLLVLIMKIETRDQLPLSLLEGKTDGWPEGLSIDFNPGSITLVPHCAPIFIFYGERKNI